MGRSSDADQSEWRKEYEISEFLKENGTIGFVAPSFGCGDGALQSAFDNALKKFRDLGYQLKLGPNCYAARGVGISNTPENCGKEINEAVIRPDRRMC